MHILPSESPSTRLVVMHCNALHVFKIMLGVYNATNTSNENVMHYFSLKSCAMLALQAITVH